MRRARGGVICCEMQHGATFATMQCTTRRLQTTQDAGGEIFICFGFDSSTFLLQNFMTLDLILNGCKVFDDTATTSVTVTCHVSRVSVRLSRVSPDPYHPLPIPAWLPGLLPISSNTRRRVQTCHCVTRPQAASYTRLWIGIFIV